MAGTNIRTGSLMENVEVAETRHYDYTVSDDPLLNFCILHLICIDTWQSHLAGSDDPSGYGRKRPAVVVAATAESSDSSNNSSTSSSSSSSNCKTPDMGGNAQQS